MPMQGTCPICSVSATLESRFCKSHHRAHLALEAAFTKWQRAYGNELTRRIFFERLLQLPETGQKVREIIFFFLENDAY